MNVLLRKAIRIAGALAIICSALTAATAQTATSRIVRAANAFQGPHLVIEYAPQRLGGEPSMHVHTMYRDGLDRWGFVPDQPGVLVTA